MIENYDYEKERFVEFELTGNEQDFFSWLDSVLSFQIDGTDIWAFYQIRDLKKDENKITVERMFISFEKTEEIKHNKSRVLTFESSKYLKSNEKEK